MRGELMWIGWVSGSTMLQGTRVMMSVLIFNGTSGRETWHGTQCVSTAVGLRAVPQASACGQQLLAASLASLLGCRL
eukprot:1136920-Pelagomonas_calceolata.AAC.2